MMSVWGVWGVPGLNLGVARDHVGTDPLYKDNATNGD